MRFIFRHCGVRLCTPHSSSAFILSLSKDAPPQAGFRKVQLVPPVAGKLVPSTLAASYEVITSLEGKGEAHSWRRPGVHFET